MSGGELDGCGLLAPRSPWRGTANPASRRSRLLLNNHLPYIHGWTNKTIVAWLREGDSLRLALLRYARIPFGPLQLRCDVRDIADIERYDSAGFKFCTDGEIPVFRVVGANVDLGHSYGDWARRPPRGQLPLFAPGPKEGPLDDLTLILGGFLG